MWKTAQNSKSHAIVLISRHVSNDDVINPNGMPSPKSIGQNIWLSHIVGRMFLLIAPNISQAEEKGYNLETVTFIHFKAFSSK